MPRTHPRLACAAACVALAALALLSGCSSKHKSTAPRPARTYRMGFAPIAARPDLPTLLATLNAWTPRADAAVVSFEVPWDSLLAGLPPDSVVMRNVKPIADYFRALGLTVFVNVDPTNGLDRASDANPLVDAGRSLTEPAIQQLLRGYVTATDTIIDPEYLGRPRPT